MQEAVVYCSFTPRRASYQLSLNTICQFSQFPNWIRQTQICWRVPIASHPYGHERVGRRVHSDQKFFIPNLSNFQVHVYQSRSIQEDWAMIFFKAAASLGTNRTLYFCGIATKLVGSELPRTGCQSVSSWGSMRKLLSVRMKTRYSSRFARREPAHMRYPRPYVKIGASGCSNQRSGRKTSGSVHTSGSMILSVCRLELV